MGKEELWKLDKYRLALKLVSLIDDQCMTTKDIKEVLKQTLLI